MLHWQLLHCNAAIEGVVTVPQPHGVHCSLLEPGAKKPCAHGTQGELVIESKIPCPGMHTHIVSFVAPENSVVLFSGQAVQSLLLLVAEKNARGHNEQGLCSAIDNESDVLAAGYAELVCADILCAAEDLPNPALHWH